MQVGFIDQLKGKLTVQCYTTVTLLMVHFSWIQYINLMKKFSSAKSSLVKTFKQLTAVMTLRLSVASSDCNPYHLLWASCSLSKKNWWKKLWNLQEHARKELLCAMARFPKAKHIALCSKFFFVLTQYSSNTQGQDIKVRKFLYVWIWGKSDVLPCIWISVRQ